MQLVSNTWGMFTIIVYLFFSFNKNYSGKTELHNSVHQWHYFTFRLLFSILACKWSTIKTFKAAISLANPYLWWVHALGTQRWPAIRTLFVLFKNQATHNYYRSISCYIVLTEQIFSPSNTKTLTDKSMLSESTSITKHNIKVQMCYTKQ